MSGDTVKLKLGDKSAGNAASEKSAIDNVSGRVKHDDRGNAIWEWAVTTGSFTLEGSTQRLQRLDNPTLALADDPIPKSETVKHNPKGVTQGYSPYDSGLLAKEEAAPRKKTDLRKLSEWLKLKKQASNNKPDEE